MAKIIITNGPNQYYKWLKSLLQMAKIIIANGKNHYYK